MEGHVVSVVANMLYRRRINGQSLVMEVPFSDIEEWAEAEPRRGRRRRTLSGRNRADIVIRDENSFPINVIEVKRRWSVKSCFKDLKRIRDLIVQYGPDQGGPLTTGVLAFMVQQRETRRETATKRLDDKIDAIWEIVEDTFNAQELVLECHRSDPREYPRRYQVRHEQNNWAHAAVCIELSAN